MAETLTEEFKPEAVRIALTSGMPRKQVAAQFDNVHAVDPDLVAGMAGFSAEEMFRDNLHYTFGFAGVLLQASLIHAGTLVGSDDADDLSGSRSDDIVFSGAGDDVVRLDGGWDILYAGDGDDWVNGGQHNDTIFGGPGNDSVIGGAGHDVLNGGSGADSLYGNAGADLIAGGDGMDSLSGGGGHDTLMGGPGDDTLVASHGHDELHGDAGDDVLLGNAGNDTLTAGVGNDTLYGGAGWDTFVFRPQDGNNILVSPRALIEGVNRIGFDTTTDTIWLQDFATVQAGNVMDFVSDGEHGAVFEAEGTRIELYNVDMSDLSADDFLF